MAGYDYDLFVIGAGSGGVRASRMAASKGARVAIAEERYLGGTCVNVGCVPKKLLVYAAQFADAFRDSGGFGWSSAHQKFDWRQLIDNKDREILRLNGIYANLLSGAGVELIEGRAVMKDAHTVEIDGRTVTAETVLIATGGRAVVPEFPGHTHVITSTEAFYLEEFPERIMIVGGGYIAVEFAGIFNGLGAKVVQLYRGPHFMRGFDDDVRFFLAEEMRKKGVDLRFNADVERIVKTEDGSFIVELKDGSEVETDLVMYATGRAPNTAGLGLEAAGVEMDAKGAVTVDENFRTSQPNIYAIGDVIDRVQLTPVAIHEAMVFVDTVYGKSPRRMDYDFIPTAVFSQPPIGTVGMTEAEARSAFGEIDVYTSEFRPMKNTLSGNQERCFMKLIVDRSSDRVVGLHMVGADAGEITQGFAVAMKAGATKAMFDATVGIHPTSAEEFVTMRTPQPDRKDKTA